MDTVQWQSRPELSRPILLAAFEGWNDAGDAASMAVGFLAQAFDAEVFATIDAEDFYDFTETRPLVRVDDDSGRRVIQWPDIEFSAARVPGGAHDLVLVRGIEPQLRWRTLAKAVAAVADQLGVELAVTLGALLADVAHTRPVRVTGSSDDRELAVRLGLRASRYEGPTGIIGVIHDALRSAGIPAASFWAAVPHYVQQLPSPKATLALVERSVALAGTALDVAELRTASADYERHVNERVADDEDAVAYVASLESAGDDDWDDPLEPGRLVEGDIDELAAEVERFLRDHPRGG